jgi:hypothetical protein
MVGTTTVARLRSAAKSDAEWLRGSELVRFTLFPRRWLGRLSLFLRCTAAPPTSVRQATLVPVRIFRQNSCSHKHLG